MWIVVGAVLFVVVFNTVALLVLLALPPLAGVLWGAFLGGLFLWWHLGSGGGRRLHRLRMARTRLRAPRGPGPLLAVACGATLLLAFGMAVLIEAGAPPLEEEDLGPWLALLEYQSSGLGWLALGLLTVVVIPIVEEFCFRGHAQRTLERRFGPAPAIFVTACLFMFLHVGVPHWSILLISFTLGLGNGAVVYLFGSIWPAVGLHGIWNLAMTIPGLLWEEPMALSGGMDTGAVAWLGAAMVATGLAAWTPLVRMGRRGIRRHEFT